MERHIDIFHCIMGEKKNIATTILNEYAVRNFDTAVILCLTDSNWAGVSKNYLMNNLIRSHSSNKLSILVWYSGSV